MVLEHALLLVEWETLDDHVEGFRGSPQYGRWRRLLHHFYDPLPLVEHYERVLTVPGQDSGRVVGQQRELRE